MVELSSDMESDPTDKDLRGHIKQLLDQLKKRLRAEASEAGHQLVEQSKVDASGAVKTGQNE